MDVSAMFPGNYLKEADLKAREILVTMKDIKHEEVGPRKDPKYVLYFNESDRGLVLNKTNATNISNIYGVETAGWMGKQIILFPATTDFQGQVTPCIRVKGPTMGSKLVGTGTISDASKVSGNNGSEPAAVSTPPAPSGETPPPPTGDAFARADLDDEIPF